MGILRERRSVARQRVPDKFGHGESSFVYIRGFRKRTATRWWQVNYEGWGYTCEKVACILGCILLV